MKKHIPIRALKKHAYISGSTGSGKSEFMRLLFYRLARESMPKKYSLVLIDPHGDLSKQIQNTKLFHKHDRLIYVDPGLSKLYTPVINPLEISSKNPEHIVTYAQNLAKAIEGAVGADMSVNMSALLIPCITLLMSKKNTTLIDLIKLLNDDEELIQEGFKMPNKAHRMVFQNFRNGHYSRTKISIATKLQSFLNYPAFYNAIIGKSSINLSKAINSGKIIVFNLSQRYFGSDASQAYGRFIISMMKSAASMRGIFRKPTFLFVDECQNFISPSINDILEQSRKYGLHIIMANQSVDRLGSIEKVALGNTSVKLVGKNDSIATNNKMARITGEDKSVFQNIKDFSFYIKAGYRKGTILRSSDFLIKDNRLNLSNEKAKELSIKMTEKYYRKIEPEKNFTSTNDDNTRFEL